MARPDVKLDNFENVYAYYRHRAISPRISSIGYAALGGWISPDVTYSPDAKLAIEDALAYGRQLILAANHLTLLDQNVLAALITKEPAFKPLAGNIFAPAKSGLFKWSLLRLAVDEMGAVPAFRTKDAQKTKSVSPEVASAMQSVARTVLADVCAARLDRGEHMAIFPEGTRNNQNRAQVAELKTGIGHTACGVDEYTRLAIVPIGMQYDLRTITHPRLHIGEIMPGPFEAPRAVTTELHERLQEAVSAAV